MTTPGENISLVLYEFHLQEVKNLGEEISQCDYGKHVIRFFENTFDTSFKSLVSSSHNETVSGCRTTCKIFACTFLNIDTTFAFSTKPIIFATPA